MYKVVYTVYPCHRSSVVERVIGNDEVGSSILLDGTIFGTILGTISQNMCVLWHYYE